MANPNQELEHEGAGVMRCVGCVAVSLLVESRAEGKEHAWGDAHEKGSVVSGDWASSRPGSGGYRPFNDPF